MEPADRAFVLCLGVLRWTGLSCTRVSGSPSGEFVSGDSLASFLVSVTVGAGFLAVFFRTSVRGHSHEAAVCETSPVVHPLYTEAVVACVVAFLACGNFHNRRFADILNRVRRATESLERDPGIRVGRCRRSGRNGERILVRMLAYAVGTSALKLLADAHVVVHCERKFRVVHYVCCYYGTLFTAHFLVTMNRVRETFAFANRALQRIGRGLRTVSGGPRRGRGLGPWAAAFVELREVEGLVNEVFGKQIFLTQSLAFAGIIVNAYYFVTLNLYGTSHLWLNARILVGISEAVAIALMNSRAADSAANEANRLGEIVFSFPVRLADWRAFNQLKHLALFVHHHPVEFNAWVFYAVNHQALFKVLLTACAITLILLQCDFLRMRLVSKDPQPTDATQ